MKKTAFVVLAIALVGIVAAAGCISTETQSPEGYWTLPGTDIIMTITPEGSVLGKSVLICDDIFTTGSTMCEAAEVLRKAGAKCVGAVAFTASKDNW